MYVGVTNVHIYLTSDETNLYPLSIAQLTTTSMKQIKNLKHEWNFI